MSSVRFAANGRQEREGNMRKWFSRLRAKISGMLRSSHEVPDPRQQMADARLNGATMYLLGIMAALGVLLLIMQLIKNSV